MSDKETLSSEDLDYLTRLKNQLPKFNKKIADAETIFTITDRKLAIVAREHPKQLSEYMKLEARVAVTLKELQVIQSKIEAIYFKQYNENHRRTLAPKDILIYMQSEEEIVLIKQAVIDVEYILSQVKAIVEGIKDLGWMISHLTKLHVAQLENSYIE